MSTDLRTRTGAPEGKDARLKNSYVEARGDQTIVRKRPAAQGGVAVGSGVPQGGIGFSIGNTSYIYTVSGDTSTLLNNVTGLGTGTSWNSGTSYAVGDHVSYGWVDYWFIDQYAADNSGEIDSTPPPNSPRWSRTYGGVCKSYPLLSPSIVGVSTTGPFESSPSIPASYQLSTTVIETLSCGGTLHENVLVIYTARAIPNQWKITATWYNQNFSSGNWIPDYNSGLITSYGATVQAAVDSAANSISPTSRFDWTPPIDTYYVDSPIYSGNPPAYEFNYTKHYGGGGVIPFVVTTGTPTQQQITLYYLDATSWKYYTIT